MTKTASEVADIVKAQQFQSLSQLLVVPLIKIKRGMRYETDNFIFCKKYAWQQKNSAKNESKILNVLIQGDFYRM